MLISDRDPNLAKLCIWKDIKMFIASVKGTGDKDTKEPIR
jgi:hypothetical protein